MLFLYIFKIIKRSLSILLYCPLALILKIKGIEIPFFHIDRLGHLMVDPDSFIKDNVLNSGRLPRAILLASINKVANKDVLRYWRKYFTVIQVPFLVRTLQPLAFHPISRFKKDPYSAVINKTAKCYSICSAWGDREPLFKLTKKDIYIGIKTLKKMGVAEGRWVVCIHNREGGYSPCDENLHSFRSFSFIDFILAIKYIVSMGGICIRMGDSSMTPAPKISGLIDYALSPFRSDLMDLYLGSSAAFFLGSNSGAYELSTMFGVPVACVNMAPISSIPRGIHAISIPMLCKKKATGEILSFKELFGSPLSNYRTSQEWQESGVELVSNTPLEIRDLAIEQLQTVQNNYIRDSETDVLQAKYNALIKPGHYCFGASPKVGSSFLKKYSDLLK